MAHHLADHKVSEVLAELRTNPRCTFTFGELDPEADAKHPIIVIDRPPDTLDIFGETISIEDLLGFLFDNLGCPPTFEWTLRTVSVHM